MFWKPKGPFNKIDEWYAWRPVRIWVWGNAFDEPDASGKYFTRSKPRRYAWFRKVKRIRGIHLTCTVYMELGS